jgi:hypothetical protein
MNTRQKWTKRVGVVVLVALASAFTAGFAGAVPGIPLLITGRNSQIASDTLPVVAVQSRSVFEQYLTALEQMELERSAQLAGWQAGESSRIRFEQCLEASLQIGQVGNAGFVSSPASEISRVRYARHLAALKKVEQDHNWDRFDEQYLAVLDQMGNAVITQPPTTAPVSEISWVRYARYLAALEQVEQDHNWDRFDEQYLAVLDQLGCAVITQPPTTAPVSGK